MFNNDLMLPAIVAASVFIIYMIAMQFIGKRGNIQQRLKQIVSSSDSSESSLEKSDKNNSGFMDSMKMENDVDGFAAVIEKFFKVFGVDVEGFRKDKQIYFYQAGIESPNTMVYYLFFKRILSFLFLGLAVYTLMYGHGTKADYMKAAFLGYIGFKGADMYIKNRKLKRDKVLTNSFPDSLDLLLACVESGLALDGSLARVCRELSVAHPVITKELNRTRMELTLLNDRSQALVNLAERNGLPAFRMLVTALLQTERFGTSLSDTLRLLSDDYRQKRMIIAEEKAARLPALITIPLMILLLPALFIIILGPAAMSITASGIR